MAILKTWEPKKEKHTWKEFIRPFALLGNCVKATELDYAPQKNITSSTTYAMCM